MPIMQITSATFVKGIVKYDESLSDGIPQVAFIGRSNVGKSSTINAVMQKKGLARSSSSPGHTREINLYLVNETYYLVDLPGYGYAKISNESRAALRDLIFSYLFNPDIIQDKIVLIIDGKVGPTKDDLEILTALKERNKNIIIAVNKIDKIKPSLYIKQIKKIQELVGDYQIIPYSAENKKGIEQLQSAVFN